MLEVLMCVFVQALCIGPLMVTGMLIHVLKDRMVRNVLSVNFELSQYNSMPYLFELDHRVRRPNFEAMPCSEI